MTAIPLHRVLEYCPVVDSPPWDTDTPLTPDMVRTLIARKGPLLSTHLGAEGTSYQHAQRIAYLALYGWKDAITIDVGVPWAGGHRGGWLVADGNHRLYAAAMRKDPTIEVDAGGCLDTFNSMFGTNL